jgi:hypothetical protein
VRQVVIMAANTQIETPYEVNMALAAHAPELAAEVLRLREPTAAETRAAIDRAWALYFPRPDGGPCKRHGWQDVEGGLCPSCVRYAVTAAATMRAGADDEPDDG